MFSLRLIIYSAHTRDSYSSSVLIVFLCQCNSVGMYAVSDSGKQLVLAERGIWLAHICEWQLESFCARCLCSSVTLPILSLLQYVNECRHSCSQPWEAREFSCCLWTPRTGCHGEGEESPGHIIRGQTHDEAPWTCFHQGTTTGKAMWCTLNFSALVMCLHIAIYFLYTALIIFSLQFASKFILMLFKSTWLNWVAQIKVECQAHYGVDEHSVGGTGANIYVFNFFVMRPFWTFFTSLHYESMWNGIFLWAHGMFFMDAFTQMPKGCLGVALAGRQ